MSEREQGVSRGNRKYPIFILNLLPKVRLICGPVACVVNCAAQLVETFIKAPINVCRSVFGNILLPAFVNPYVFLMYMSLHHADRATLCSCNGHTAGLTIIIKIAQARTAASSSLSASSSRWSSTWYIIFANPSNTRPTCSHPFS